MIDSELYVCKNNYYGINLCIMHIIILSLSTDVRQTVIPLNTKLKVPHYQLTDFYSSCMYSDIKIIDFSPILKFKVQ